MIYYYQFLSDIFTVTVPVKIYARGGNYWLNIGLNPGGTFLDESIQRLKKIELWMKVNSKRSTECRQAYFLHYREEIASIKKKKETQMCIFRLFNWSKDRQLLVTGLTNKVVSVKLLATGIKQKT